MNEDFENRIYEIALNTFELTCFMFPLEEWEIEEANTSSIKAGEQLKSIVYFDGAAKGGLILSSTTGLVNAIAANMLGVEQATDEEKEGALCEIANIICGNMVPLFAKNEHICFIQPPQIAKEDEIAPAKFKGMHHNQVRILLDEGIADISIYHTTGESND